MTNDIKQLDSWVESSRSLFEETRKLNMENIYAMGFNDELIKSIYDFNDERIDGLTLAECDELFEKYGIDKTDVELIYSKSFLKDKSYLTYIKEKLKEAKNDLLEIKKAEDELKDIEMQVRNLKQSFIDYVRSPEFKEKKKENIDRLKEALENETDEVKKNKYLEQLKIIENIESSKFLLDRLDKYGKKEINSILNSFFDNKKGEYMMERFKTSCSKFGFKPEIYQYFFNLEENLLPEEYHVFNNLFLFVCMRFIAYADINVKSDKMYVEKTINNLAHLIYHDFQNEEEEKEFLNLIKNIDDRFREHEELFKEQNTTHPNHPVRIEHTRIYKENKRKDLIEELTKDYPEKYLKEDLDEKSFDELREIQEKELTNAITEELESVDNEKDSKLNYINLRGETDGSSGETTKTTDED